MCQDRYYDQGCQPSPPHCDFSGDFRADRLDDQDKRHADHRARILKSVCADVTVFDFSREPKDFIDWESSMNSYFRWYRMADDLCVEYAEMRLGGQVKIYWENESHEAYRRGEPITSWAGMASRLRNKYVPRQYESTLFLNWLDLRQGKMHVRDYIQAFEECRMTCRFVEDSPVVLGIFTHRISPQLRNEVLKRKSSKVDEAYRIVEHMERPTEDSPVIPPMTTTKAVVTRPAPSPPTAPTRASVGGGRTTLATSVGYAPPPRLPPTDVLDRATAASQAHITCFKYKGKGHRMSQCPSSNLLIEIEELGSGHPENDVTLGDDIYIANASLVDECEDILGLVGYI